MNLRRQFHWVFLLWTFPGVVIHELAHAEFCRYYKIPVKETCYFQLDHPAGYVIHARPRSYIVAFMISVAPAILNTVIAFLLGALFVTLIFPFEGVLTLPSYPVTHLVGGLLSAWIGMSAGVHALPSRQDAKEIWSQTRSNWYNPVVFAVVPIVLLIELLNRLRALNVHIVAGIGMFVIGGYVGLNADLVFSLLYEFLNEWISA